MQPTASQEQIDHICELVRGFGYMPHLIKGTERTVVAAVGPGDKKEHIETFKSADGVEDAFPILQPFKLVSKEVRKEKTIIRVGDVTIGDGGFVVMAGPCSVESEEQLMVSARAVKAAGATVLRGGAYKPRTSPYEFQGLGPEGLRMLAAARAETGLRIITEVLGEHDVDLVAGTADILQIGARNAQNFRLLVACARSGKPVLLKRGMSMRIEEWLLAAEYLLAHGNPNVILCERGIRTFEDYTRNTLDLAAVAIAKQETHLPVIVDPSQGCGRADLVKVLCRGAAAVGADGLIIEVHPNPAEALSDGQQQLDPEAFATLVGELRPFVQAAGRSL